MEITHEHLNKLDCMQKFIKEVLRMYSPACVTLLRVCVNDHFINKFKITKNNSIATAFLALNCFKE